MIEQLPITVNQPPANGLKSTQRNAQVERGAASGTFASHFVAYQQQMSSTGNELIGQDAQPDLPHEQLLALWSELNIGQVLGIVPSAGEPNLTAEEGMSPADLHQWLSKVEQLLHLFTSSSLAAHPGSATAVESAAEGAVQLALGTEAPLEAFGAESLSWVESRAGDESSSEQARFNLLETLFAEASVYTGSATEGGHDGDGHANVPFADEHAASALSDYLTELLDVLSAASLAADEDVAQLLRQLFNFDQDDLAHAVRSADLPTLQAVQLWNKEPQLQAQVIQLLNNVQHGLNSVLGQDQLAVAASSAPGADGDPSSVNSGLFRLDGQEIVRDQQMLSSPVRVESLASPSRQQHLIDDLQHWMKLQARVLKNGETTQIRLKLFPENLGHMDVRISSTDGKVSAQFFVSSQLAHDALERQMQQLRWVLNQQGIQAERLEVVSQHTQSQAHSQAQTQSTWQQAGQDDRQQGTQSSAEQQADDQGPLEEVDYIDPAHAPRLTQYDWDGEQSSFSRIDFAV